MVPPMQLETLIKCPRCDGSGKIKTVNASALRDLRKAKGLSLRQLAKSLHFSAPYLSDIELGRRNCTPEILELYRQL